MAFSQSSANVSLVNGRFLSSNCRACNGKYYKSNFDLNHYIQNHDGGLNLGGGTNFSHTVWYSWIVLCQAMTLETVVVICVTPSRGNTKATTALQASCSIDTLPTRMASFQWVGDHGAATLGTDYLATAHMDDPDLKGVADWFVGLCKGPNKDREARKSFARNVANIVSVGLHNYTILVVHLRTKNQRGLVQSKHLACVREWICKHWVQDSRLPSWTTLHPAEHGRWWVY